LEGGHGEHTDKTPSYETKMLLKVVFDKTAFVKFTISNDFEQNIDETHSKQQKFHRKIHTSLWKIHAPKVSRLLPNVCDFQKENHTQKYGFNNP
jgi:hypothetical protein